MTQAQQRPASPMPPEQQEGQGIEAEMGLKPQYKAPDYRGADRAMERGEYIAAASTIHSKLQKLVAGALRA